MSGQDNIIIETALGDITVTSDKEQGYRGVNIFVGGHIVAIVEVKDVDVKQGIVTVHTYQSGDEAPITHQYIVPPPESTEAQAA